MELFKHELDVCPLHANTLGRDSLGNTLHSGRKGKRTAAGVGNANIGATANDVSHGMRSATITDDASRTPSPPHQEFYTQEPQQLACVFIGRVWFSYHFLGQYCYSRVMQVSSPAGRHA